MVAVNADKQLKKVFWAKLTTHVRSGGKFFEDMELLPDAHILLEYLSKYQYVICSATGHVLNAKEEKTAAVRRHLGDLVADTAQLVQRSAEKAQYASSTSILIDDRTKSIDPWIAAGGIGILHTSATTTIEKLKELGM